MSCILILLMAIDVVVLVKLVPLGVPLPHLLYPVGKVIRKVIKSVTT
jgi:hypothetical protein